MKTQERAAASVNRGVAGMAPGGDRLPSAPRERKPALAALAALLVLLGALGATVLVMRAGDRMEAVAITQDVPQGQRVPDSAIKSVLVAEDSNVKYVPWEQRGLLKTKYWADTKIVKGSVLVGDMLTEEKGVGAGKVVVGLSLKSGQYPPGLQAGDSVSAYRVGDEASENGGRPGSGNSGAGATEPVLTDSAEVQSVKKGNDDSSYSGDLPVSIVVSQTEAGDLTSAASNGEVSLVVNPSSGSGS